MNENQIQDTVVTLVDFIESQLAQEREAAEVLPYDFEKCTYSLGYIRQSVYVCRTCTPPGASSPAGFCYSCSIACHGDHDLVELFHKRHFRCDCGLQCKTPCTLDKKEGAESNLENKYGHNFEGRFCWCNTIYDPESETSSMYQCIVCEDWYHDSCIGEMPPSDDFDDYICRTCTEEHPFLRRYHNSRFIRGRSLPGGKVNQLEGISFNVDGEVKATSEKGEQCDIHGVKKEEASVENEKHTNSELVDEVGSRKRCNNEEETYSIKKAKLQNKCQLGNDDSGRVDLFLKEGWRSTLCQCDECKILYKRQNIEFLLGEEQTYEPELDKDRGVSLLEAGMNQLSRMDRIQAIEGAIAYNKLRDQLRTFLRPFVESGKTVTSEDIQGFFEGKMQKLEEKRLRR
ncbi:uncharacterized protein VTP21DRAFT_11042 [Calcarisporiella thermophila]|uniref:uncharacterized protein n=1 Tax=Calcarisporiella thermophila TaxID=911321 RepID=UPI003743AF60